jgi:hypothetical protein
MHDQCMGYNNQLCSYDQALKQAHYCLHMNFSIWVNTKVERNPLSEKIWANSNSVYRHRM